MNVAVTVWGSRISPVIDASRTLLVAEIQEHKIASQYTLALQSGRVDQLVRLLHERDISTLFCGALCERSVTALAEGGIEIVPFLSGEALSALQLWLKGGDLGVLLLPGCRRAHLWRKNRESTGQKTIPDLRKDVRLRRGKRGKQYKEDGQCQILTRTDLQDRDR